MIKPYYQDEWVTLYHGDSLELMTDFADKSFQAVITDPPYSERTHSKARSTVKGEVVAAIDFLSFTDEDLFNALSQCGRLSSGWVIATLDYNHAFRFETHPPINLRQLRIGVWVKNNPTPQITGDRPAQGWEAISYLHGKGKATWNGGGRHGNYVSNTATPTGHPTPKPLSMLSSFVERFTNPGESILDPFAGGGTTLLAARNLGRKAVGIELDEKYCELIAKRMSQQAFDFDGI